MKLVYFVFLVFVVCSCKSNLSQEEFFNKINNDSLLVLHCENDIFKLYGKLIPSEYLALSEVQVFKNQDSTVKYVQLFEKDTHVKFKLELRDESLAQIPLEDRNAFLTSIAQRAEQSIIMRPLNGPTVSPLYVEISPAIVGTNFIEFLVKFPVNSKNIAPFTVEIDNSFLGDQQVYKLDFSDELLKKYPVLAY